MQEDESQPEQEMQPTSERGAEENQTEQQEQPTPEDKREESQPEPEPQPVSESGVGEGQPESDVQPPAAPIPLPVTAKQKRWQYFLSLVLGFIPVIVLLVTYSIGIAQGEFGLGTLVFGGLLAVILYVIELIVMIVFLTNKQRRFIGYGLLTAFLVTPVVTAIGCTVIPNLIHP